MYLAYFSPPATIVKFKLKAYKYHSYNLINIEYRFYKQSYRPYAEFCKVPYMDDETIP